ncbi:MAG: murein biosynthesis integral membrane protein MurJ [Gaiellales bacterium]
MASDRRLAASTAAFGSATALSRVAGVVRESIAAGVFGSGATLSAFNIAFNIPNLIRSVVADNTISAAFVPVFVELRERNDEREAWRVASMVLWLTAVVLGGISALFVLLAPWVMPLLMFGQDNVSTGLVVTLSRWMFPIVAVLGLTGVVTGILNSYQVFGVPAIAPVAWNLVIIAALGLFAHGSDVHRATVYAVGVLAATVIQFLIPLPLLRGRSAGLAYELGWGNPHVRRILRLMLPVSLGLGLINANLTVDVLVAAHASSHAVSDLNFAFRVYMLPQGLFSVAVTAVLFPEISRLVARGDGEGFARRMGDGANAIVFLLLPAAAVSIALAEPIARLLYQHGSFTRAATVDVAHTLMAFSLGLVFNGLSLLLTRAFFSMQLPRVPTQVAVANLVLNLVLDLLLYRPLGAAGIALSTSVVTLFSAGALSVLLRRRVGALSLGGVAGQSLRTALATVYCAVAAFGVWWPLDQLLGRSILAQAASLLLALAAAAAAYQAAGRLLAVSGVEVVASMTRFGR